MPKQATHLSTVSNINEDDVLHPDVHENPPIGTIPTIPNMEATGHGPESGQDNISNPSNVNPPKTINYYATYEIQGLWHTR